MSQFGPEACTRLIAVSALLLSLFLAGCGPDTSPKEITATRTVKPLANAPKEKPTTGQIAWVAPEGWVRGTERNMRLVTFHPGGDRSAECYITVLGGAAGGVEANLNRWRDQMGMKHLTAAEIAALPTITVLGRSSRLLVQTGTFGGKEGQSMFGVVCPLPGRLVTIKMTGPERVLESARAGFVRFCESIHLS